MKLVKSVTLIFLLGFTLLMINDYFPNTLSTLNISKWVVVSTMVVVLVISGFVMKDKENEKQSLNWLIYSTGYIFLLMIVLSILGGSSSTGISFTNPIIWILLGITVVEIINKKKKLRAI